MFKKIENWLEAKQDATKQEQYDAGFGYAATQILKYDSDMSDLDPIFDVTSFDRGIADASRILSDIRYKAKKLERIEAENKDLREIVQLMQKELGRLLVQLDEVSKPQALSQVFTEELVEKAKLPFKLEELPEWANWVAQDKNGHWYAYSNEPTTEWKNIEGRYPGRWNLNGGNVDSFSTVILTRTGNLHC